MTLPGYVADVIRRLEENGHSAYAVGGCVRDMLMGRVPHDYDVCTDALPEQTKNAFPDRTTIDTGIALSPHGAHRPEARHGHGDI